MDSTNRSRADQMGVETHRLVECEPCEGSGVVPAPLLVDSHSQPVPLHHTSAILHHIRQTRNEQAKMMAHMRREMRDQQVIMDHIRQDMRVNLEAVELLKQELRENYYTKADFLGSLRHAADTLDPRGYVA